MQAIKQRFTLNNAAHLLFWTWNGIFLAFMLLGFAPTLLPEMIAAIDSGEIPLTYLTYAILITLIPAIALLLGFVRLRHQPGKLFMLGYGVEGPLMVMLLIRFFIVREMTLVVGFMLTIATIGMLTLLWHLLDPRINERNVALSYLRFIGLTMLLLIGLYVSLWLAFYALLFGSLIVDTILDIASNLSTYWDSFWKEITYTLEQGFFWLILFLSWLIVMAYTATLFVLMPIAIPVIYFLAWRQAARALLTKQHRWAVIGSAAAVLIICISGFWLTNQQPQHAAFTLMETPPTTITEAQTLLDQQEIIRRGLLNSYLAPQRYVSAMGEVDHIAYGYREQFGLNWEQARQVQQWYETVASPVLYQPITMSEENPEEPWRRNRYALREEPLQAAELYEQFFDQPIVEGEKEAVVHAVRSTWSIEQARNAWQAVDDREIYLSQQALTVTEHGDWAEFELHEVYENQTRQRQEVVYYFSLPESATITGVWLGNSPNRAERFDYKVAPRGAAQATYRNEVRRNIDPALVEQIGPRQYRLRVFPIEPAPWEWDEDRNNSYRGEAPPMHLWLTWQLFAEDGVWPMPYLADERNVYWDGNSQRQVNGAPMTDLERWLPSSLPVAGNAERRGHRVDFPNGQSVIIQPAAARELPDLSPQRLAIVVDRSRSMADLADEVAQAFAVLEQTGSMLDVYLTASEYRGEPPRKTGLDDINPAEIIYYGGQNPADLLTQFEALSDEEQYEAILVLTDGGGYQLTDDSITFTTPSAPLWMVHLAGQFPLGYHDDILEGIQASGGGVVAQVETALTRLAVSLDDRAGNPTAETTFDSLEGYDWQTMPTAEAEAEFGDSLETHLPSEPFAAFAARRLILATMQQQRHQLEQLDILDGLHALAIEHSIVTPYSSMIVLVTKQQEKLLKRLEEGDDRFEREFEDVGETEGQLAVSGVPEPEEWLLIALVVGMLGWGYWRKRNGAGLSRSVGV